MTIFFISAAIAAGLFFYFFPLYKKEQEGLLVLTYHNIGTPPAKCRQKSLWISPAQFTTQLEQLKKNGFTFVTAQDVLAGKLPPKSVLITFDNGYKNFFTQAFPILSANNISSLVFMTVDYIGKCNFWHDTKKGPWQQMMNEKEIETLTKSGLVTFGSKTLTNAKLTQLEQEERDSQIAESAYRLQTLYKIKPQFFAYPYSLGFDDEQIKNKVSSVYALSFADTGKLNAIPLEAGALINRVQVKSWWNKFVFYCRITGR